MISDINQLDLSKKYTYSDYLTWKFDEMVELIRGKVYRMSPAPNKSHQDVSSELHYQIKHFLRKKRCRVYHAPFDVRLPLPPNYQHNHKIDTVVQPDLSVICDLSKLDEQGCNGVPDWIIEILSRSTAQKDLTEKFELYQFAGVKEYWIVHPSEGTVIPYFLNKVGKYELIRQTPFVSGEFISVNILEGLSIDLGEVFKNI